MNAKTKKEVVEKKQAVKMFEFAQEDHNLLISDRRPTIEEQTVAEIGRIDQIEDMGDGNLTAKNLVSHGFKLQDVDQMNDSGNSILVVDDCSFNIIAIQSLLQQFNLKSDFCNDGLEAIEMVSKRQQSFDSMYKLILCDYSMPDCDGPSATIAIRQQLLDHGMAREQQPFMACLSAYQEKSFKDIASAAGFDLFMVKPVFKAQIHKLLIKANLMD